MQSLSSHLTVLEEAAARYPDRHAFRIAEKSSTSDSVDAWIPKSYKEFHSDVEQAARYWAADLSCRGLPPRSVVGLW